MGLLGSKSLDKVKINGGKRASEAIKELPELPLPIKDNISIPDENEQRTSRKSQDSLRRQAEEAVKGLDTKRNYNFAFVGNVGVGKSMLINSLRSKFRSNEPDFAPVGEMETTQAVRSYVHPLHDHIVFWDFPGGGTTKRPKANYFYEQQMFAFDHIIIVVADRITELDVVIAQEATRCMVPFNFVRSKADLDIDNKFKRGTNLNDVKRSLRKVVYDDFHNKLNTANISVDHDNLFYISDRGFEFASVEYATYEMDEVDFLCYVVQRSIERRTNA